MGKQRMTQLLAQLKENQAQDVENAAAIYTVAQVAVDALNPALPASSGALLPAAPGIDKAELLRRHGSYKACRRAAKEQGIRFRKNPSWSVLAAAFSAHAACESLVRDYLAAHSNQYLQGVTFEIALDDYRQPSAQV